jgi:hypothetical protein
MIGGSIGDVHSACVFENETHSSQGDGDWWRGGSLRGPEHISSSLDNGGSLGGAVPRASAKAEKGD